MNGQNLLHVAASAREGNIVGFMIDRYREAEKLNLVLNQPDQDGCTPLHVACKSGSKESVWLLAEAGAKIDIRDNAGRTPLETCQQLIDEVAQNSAGSFARQPNYHYHPYQHGKFGSEPNSQTNDGGQMVEITHFLGQAVGQAPPLRGDYMPDPKKHVRYRECLYTEIIRKGDYGVFQRFIEQGMDFAPIKDRSTLDPLTLVADGGYTFLFDMVAQSFPDKSWLMGNKVAPPYFLTAVMTTEPNMPIIRLLVEKFGADVNVTKSGSTTIWDGECGNCEFGALHIIARGYVWWHKEVLKYLLEKGADPNLTDESGLSPLDEKIEDPEVVDLLVRYGGKPNRPDRSRALCKAIEDRNLQAVRDILDFGQDPNFRLPEQTQPSDPSFGIGAPEKTSRGHSKRSPRYSGIREGYPLELAAAGNFDEDRVHRALPIVNLLLEYGADPFKQSKRDEKRTILHQLLVESEYLTICEPFLNQKGLNLETRDSYGDTLIPGSLQAPESVHEKLHAIRALHGAPPERCRYQCHERPRRQRSTYLCVSL
ncbi:uncharacterized protein N7482_010435 [Penicillium canariense]|uniref:Ankyrin repeat protein n=1 Tax=Penicillium canariense TaxID=189055 RepID=A0A9W9HLZ0_9EURO|nr:uncharacterized protein N7482_010435 [Penicillium canariense]KAJ5151183.1 hypothetical protein N7482_010435 [Penicillium canariense]